MTKTLMFALIFLFGLLMIAACTSTNAAVIPTTTPSSTPQADVENKTLPTPIPAGQTIVYEDLRVEMRETEITSSYITEYGTEREPPAGKKFIWIHILLKNISQSERTLPATEHFSALNGTTEFKATYGHRKDHADYMSLTPTLIQGQEADAWLRFDIPTGLKLEDLIFAFLPESSQISFRFPSSQYPWGNHPIYLWACAP